ncbi:hypothetical protein [Paenibacillus sp. LHD-38]|uniref:hypothetical protein n=1 Tax=Paenibacillus sp. LHD-38 TaxID=3072143 RepID=UPI00280FE4E1|nr:hypothetical protein [Paenibacillus sp. LHD-38]MDQ8732990.1 hypothetical protein [Paenibacillus sp. LHD-38]
MGFTARQYEIVLKIATAAQKQPVLSSGLWFHHDIRDNFYYASYLFSAAVEQPEQLTFEAKSAKETAEAILLEVLALQDQNPSSVTYGHWPLNLGTSPRAAAPNILPVELMGSLMAFFASRYRSHFDSKLQQSFDSALNHVYQSGFYRQNNVFGHHDAKYTAAKLIYGEWFEDAALLEDGRSNLQLTLAHVRKHGMSEYNSLPWFWHWVQAFTCAWHLIKDQPIKQELADMLDFLWKERAEFYLKGAFVGAHCRAQKHDIPLDGNVLHDYVQFGDFELPAQLPRTEYAGFLIYEAPEDVRDQAINRSEPAEVKKSITKHSDAGTHVLHSYAYITEEFAAGGMWERYAEFDNEQHRWDISLPLGQQAGVNQAYFFHPSGRNAGEDPRHQTENTEVLFYKNTIVALYSIPEGIENRVIGILPNMEWMQEPGILLGQANHLYWSVYLMQLYELERLSDRCVVTSEGAHNGVIIEVTSQNEAKQRGIDSFEAFASEARRNSPAWSTEEKLSVHYVSRDETKLELSVGSQGGSDKRINGNTVDFSEYTH